MTENSLEQEAKMLDRRYNDLMASFIEAEDHDNMSLVTNAKGFVSKAVVSKAVVSKNNLK